MGSNRVVTFKEVFKKDPPASNPHWAPVAPAKPCPAVEELVNTLKKYPAFEGKNWFDALPVLQTTSAKDLDRHNAGLALDIILISPDHPALFRGGAGGKRTWNEAQESLCEIDQINAHQLVKIFLKLKGKMKFRSMIYEKVAWDSSKGLKPQKYTNDIEHYTHIHIDWLNYSLVTWKSGQPDGYAVAIEWSDEASTTGFSGDLATELDSLFDSDADPRRKEDLMTLS